MRSLWLILKQKWSHGYKAGAQPAFSSVQHLGRGLWGEGERAGDTCQILAAQDLFPVEATLQPIRNITQMWVVPCLISVEFLHSFLRHHFTGNHLGGITKCQLFSRANTNLAVSLLSRFLRSLGTRLCCRWYHTCIFSITHNQFTVYNLPSILCKCHVHRILHSEIQGLCGNCWLLVSLFLLGWIPWCNLLV